MLKYDTLCKGNIKTISFHMVKKTEDIQYQILLRINCVFTKRFFTKLLHICIFESKQFGTSGDVMLHFG